MWLSTNVLRYMAVSRNWGVLILGVLVIRDLPFGVYYGAPDFWKLPYGMDMILQLYKECGLPKHVLFWADSSGFKGTWPKLLLPKEGNSIWEPQYSDPSIVIQSNTHVRLWYLCVPGGAKEPKGHRAPKNHRRP